MEQIEVKLEALEQSCECAMVGSFWVQVSYVVVQNSMPKCRSYNDGLENRASCKFFV